MAQPGTYILEFRTNTTLRESFLVEDDDGNAVDLTGYTALAQLVTAPGEAPYLEMSTADGTITLGADGSVELTVDVDVMFALDEFSGEWDLLLKSPDGTVEAKLAGAAYGRLGASDPGDIP